MVEKPPIVFIVAGTDPSAGAGIPADLRTCYALGCWGAPVVSAVVAQSTQGVRSFEVVSTALFEAQWAALCEDLQPSALKIGMVGSAGLCASLRPHLLKLQASGVPVIWDPVLASGGGVALNSDLKGKTLVEEILESLPAVELLTPNIPELETLTGAEVGNLSAAAEAARVLISRGASSVLVKGGHLPGAPGDVLVQEEGSESLASPSLGPIDVHGTGCQLASAIACQRARGLGLREAVIAGRAHFFEKLRQPLSIGKGSQVLGFGSLQH